MCLSRGYALCDYDISPFTFKSLNPKPLFLQFPFNSLQVNSDKSRITHIRPQIKDASSPKTECSNSVRKALSLYSPPGPPIPAITTPAIMPKVLQYEMSNGLMYVFITAKRNSVADALE
jgi:hypothetical protein